MLPCHRCGGEKPSGRGRRLCASCEPKNQLPKTMTPCRACGEAKSDDRRRCSLCAECARLRAEARVTRDNVARTIRNAKPCRGCGRGPGRFKTRDGERTPYCPQCQVRRAGLSPCTLCKAKPVRSRLARLCEDCKATQRERERAYHKQYSKDHPRHGERKVTRADRRTREYRRMRNRLTKDQVGLEIVPKDFRYEDGTRPDSHTFPVLSALPLVVAMNQIIQRERAISPAAQKIADGRKDSVRLTVCGRVGVSERTLYAWEHGERVNVQFDVADRIITGLGLLWFDVYGDDPVAAAAFTGESIAA